MKIILTLFNTLLFIPCFSQNPSFNIDTLYHDNGKIKKIRANFDNKLISEKDYFEDGTLKRKMKYVDKDIIYVTQYFDTSHIQYIAMYNEKLTIGFSKEFYSNGILKEYYINTENGILPWEVRDSIGNHKIKNGNTSKSYRRKNKLSTRTNLYKNGLKNGTWIWYSPEGYKFKLSKEKKSRLGLRLFKYKNGVLKVHKEFRDGKRTIYK